MFAPAFAVMGAHTHTAASIGRAIVVCGIVVGLLALAFAVQRAEILPRPHLAEFFARHRIGFIGIGGVSIGPGRTLHGLLVLLAQLLASG